MEQITVSLTDEQYAKIESLASDEGGIFVKIRCCKNPIRPLF